MNDIINQIIAIEQKAQEMLADAEKQKSEILNAVKTDCEKKAFDIDERRKRRIRILSETEQNAAVQKMEAVKEDCKQKTEALDACYAAMKNEWVNEIYHNIIGR